MIQEGEEKEMVARVVVVLVVIVVLVVRVLLVVMVGAVVHSPVEEDLLGVQLNDAFDGG